MNSDFLSLITAQNIIDNIQIVGKEENRVVDKIPFIKFPSTWYVKIIPPFSGATVRFLINKTGDCSSYVSVYLDCWDILGCVGKPYWEVYPVDGDVERCFIHETDELISIISKALLQISNNK